MARGATDFQKVSQPYCSTLMILIKTMKRFTDIQVASFVFALALWTFDSVLFAQSTTVMPAKSLEAAKVLDLSKFAKINPSQPQNVSTEVIATQSYTAKGNAELIGKQVRDALIKHGLKELEGASYTEAYSSAVFESNGFKFTLMAFPASEKGEVMVSIQNHGNVALDKLPMPPDLKLSHSLPTVSAYLSDQTVEATSAACLKALEDQGWKPFGTTSVSFYVKKNAVRVSVMVMQAPAQGNKTMVQYSSEQMSADLPVPPEIEWLQYTDSPTLMTFRTHASKAALVEYFRETLRQDGWEATTNNLVEVGFREVQIFRRPAKDLIELEIDEVDGHLNCDLRYQTAAQVEAQDERVEAQLEEAKKQAEMKAERAANPTVVGIAKLPNATIKEQADTRIEYGLKSGAAKSAVTQWAQALTNNGWELKKNVDTKEIGDYSLTKNGVELHIDYVDPGFIAAEVSIEVRGSYKLQVEK